jgi:hypothetical protein
MAHKHIREKRAAQEAEAKKKAMAFAQALQSYSDPRSKKWATKNKTCQDILSELRFTPISSLPEPKLQEKPHSKNPDKQVYEVIQRFVCKYPMPKALFKVFKPRNINPEVDGGVNLTDEHTRNMFLSIAEGASAYKVLSTHYYGVTRAIAHAFMNRSSEDKDWLGNVWRAKIEVLCGGQNKAYHKLVNKFLDRMPNAQPEKFWDDAITIFSREVDAWSSNELTDIMDFLRHKHYNEPTWTLKGRTIGSLIKLSNDWHRFQIKGTAGEKIEWNPLGKDMTFELVHTFQREKTNIVWVMQELCNSNALSREGTDMRHCVGAYHRMCKDGNTSIFSIKGFARHFEDEPIEKIITRSYMFRATIEVTRTTWDNKLRVAQCREKYNAIPQRATADAVKYWCDQKEIRKGVV